MSKDTNTVTVKDLAFVLRLTHAQTLVSPSDVVTASGEKIDSRYARELLALGVAKDLLYTEEDDQLGDVWMLTEEPAEDLTYASENDGEPNYHATSETLVASALDITWDQVADAIERAQGKTPKAKKDKPKPVTSVLGKDGKPRLCTCGCGENLQGKSMYRPGHDARHAGWVARHIASQPTDEREFDALNELPTQALRDKASAHAERIIAKNAKKGKQADEPTTRVAPVVIKGKIKLGRWDYFVETDPSVPSGAVLIKSNGARVEVPENKYDTISWDPAV